MGFSQYFSGSLIVCVKGYLKIKEGYLKTELSLARGKIKRQAEYLSFWQS
ncbi:MULTISPECIES: hypothetical protein [Eikenella]|nr:MULTISPECIES: hypothetical protein [Eikenella]